MNGSELTIAVVGTYRSGSSAVAGVLHYLGVDMGAPYWGQYFEPAELAQALRHWWSEPRLIASMSTVRREHYLREWLKSRQRDASLVGAKHPLLSLCTRDLLQAWGPDVRFVWCQRPLPAAIQSLEKMNWWPDAERIQHRLHAANSQFFRDRPSLKVDFQELRESPAAVVARLADRLGLKPSREQIAEAVNWIEDWPRSQLASNAARCTAPGCSNSGSTASNPIASAACRSEKIVGTMLSGNSQSVVAAAVASVIDWVDELCLIDTGISDGTREQVARVAKEKLWVASFPWCNDFAAARNAALRLAAERGAGWALTIDTDERLHLTNYKDIVQLRRALAEPPGVQAWTVPVRHGSYSKERFIRLPCALQWRGRTHETLTSERSYYRRKLEGCHFWELGKSPTKQSQKLHRDLHILLEETESQPLNARWWYYLGQTYEGLRQYRKAVEAFEQCIRLDGWPDESAWACYTAARCLVAMHEYREAEEYCCLGMSRKPSSPELPWLAGWCCFQRGAFPAAVTWCKVAIVLGRDTPPENATMFRHVPAWYEAPYDVLRHVFRSMGNGNDAATAEEDFLAAKAHRLSLFPSSG